MADPPSDESPDEKLSHERLLAYTEGYADGRREAEEKARQEAVLRTPQDLVATTEEGHAWLEAPEQAAAFEANQLVARFFHIACALMDDELPAELRKAFGAQVFDTRRRLAISLADSPEQRRDVFLAEFSEQVRRCKRAVAIFQAGISKEAPSKTPEKDERCRRLIDDSYERTAGIIKAYFSRTYPDDSARLSLENLTPAVRSGVSATGKQGRRKDDDRGLYQHLSEAIASTSFPLDRAKLMAKMNRLRAEKTISAGPNKTTRKVDLAWCMHPALSLSSCSKSPPTRPGPSRPRPSATPAAWSRPSRASPSPRSPSPESVAPSLTWGARICSPPARAPRPCDHVFPSPPHPLPPGSRKPCDLA